MDEQEVCKCKPAVDPHVCPYCAEVYNDRETLCRCCAECQRKCKADI